jgi:hypothetical protein
MKTGTILRYMLAGAIVIILGALAGWYFFLRSQTGATTALNASRGFGSQVPAGSPFGNTDTSGPAFGPTGGTGTTTAAEPPQLWHITKAPVGGIGFATSTQGVRVRYAERSTGYVFQVNPLDGGIVRLTNSLTPKTYEVYFAPQDRVIERSLDAAGAIATFAGFINTSTTSSLTGVSLPKDIAAVAPDPKAPQLLYLQLHGGGVVGMTSGWNGSKQKQVFVSVLSDWRISWLPDGRIILVQKAADGLAGYAYTLKGAALQPLLGPLPGLTILPRTGSSALLYSTSSGGGLALFVRVSATTSVTRLPIATVADKCVWAPGAVLIAYCAAPQVAPIGAFLDAWYRGEIHSRDAIWRIDAGANQAQLIFAPSSDISLDVINPVIDDGGSYIAFMNAADQSPWLLRLNK